jgi:uncharacterized RDD family membrane protein YckC
MQGLSIETAQNVVVRHEVASLGDRIVAYLIDTLVLAAWVFLWAILAFSFLRSGPDELVSVVLFVVIMFPLLFYHLVCEISMDGQSIGKRVRRIRVARLDGAQPTLGQYLLRWVLRPIDSFYWIGLVVILINGRGQRLGDIAAGTSVVSLKQRLRLQDTMLAEVKDDHVVRFPETVRLNDRQATMILEALRKARTPGGITLIEELADKVRNVIGNPGTGMGSLEFLGTVLRDYVHLTGRQATNR